MISFKKFVMPALLAVVAAATVGDAASIFDGIPFLESLVDFFSLGSFGSLAVVGAGAAEVTAESNAPAGTTVVSTDGDGNGANYLEDDLNPTLVKIRPQDTPIDTITRMIGNTEKSEAWEAGGWEIGTREVSDTITKAITANDTTVQVATPDMWLVGDTFVLINDKGAVLDTANKPISCLVTAKSGQTLSVQRVGATANTTMPAVAITTEVTALRLSRAVSELTASVSGFAIQPTDRKYFNQTHMCQKRQGTSKRYIPV